MYSFTGWLFFRFVSLRLNVPVNNFSVMLGRSYRFLGMTSTFGSKCILFVGPEWSSKPRPLNPECEALTTRPSRSPWSAFLIIMINAPQKTQQSNDRSVNVPIPKGERWIIVNAWFEYLSKAPDLYTTESQPVATTMVR